MKPASNLIGLRIHLYGASSAAVVISERSYLCSPSSMMVSSGVKHIVGCPPSTSESPSLALGLELVVGLYALVWRINLHGLAPGKLKRVSMRRVRSNGMHYAIGRVGNKWVDRPATQMIPLTDGRTGRQEGRHMPSTLYGLWNDPKSDTVMLMHHGLELVARPF